MSFDPRFKQVSGRVSDQVSAARLVRMLEEAQWIRTGGREGLYVRYAPPEVAEIARTRVPSDPEGVGPDVYGTSSVRRTIVVPLNTKAPDYSEMLTDAVNALQWLPSPSAGYTWLSRLTSSPTDQFSFAKETRAPKGWIQWDEGESLISAARGMLVAGAKSACEPLKYFGNKYGQFANRFLDDVMMGQTAVGSYVVRAYVPSDSEIPLRNRKDPLQGFDLPGLDAMSSRAISEALVATLSHTVEALDHWRASGTLAGFTDRGVGLSYEAVTAVKMLAQNADVANVVVSWDAGRSVERPSDAEFKFGASDVPILERAAHELVAPLPQREVSAEGKVHLLSRADADGPGVVGVTTIDGTPAKKLRVLLDVEDYHRAVGAHDRGSIITVTGNLEREGNLSYLYQARISGISRINETDMMESRGQGVVPSAEDIPFEGL